VKPDLFDALCVAGGTWQVTAPHRCERRDGQNLPSEYQIPMIEFE
jgi:hypothetical protein